MQRDKHTIITSLTKKGFIKRDGGKHIGLCYVDSSGRKTIAHTSLSYSHKKIGEPLLSKMARDCQVDKIDFLHLIDCPLSRDEYESKLREKDV